MKNYYNEIEPTAILWLQAAMDAGIITPGDIDTRPIQEVKADDIRGYTQCHFFAGIGGWDIALNLAGWGDAEVWTGSCPCQPFSSAGRQKGKADERHLWPVWYGLIRELRPATVFGEQVSSAIAHGWLDDVYQGLESEGYAVGSAVLPACSVGAPHKRDRLWFVAESEGIRGSEGLPESRRGGNGSYAGKGCEPEQLRNSHVADREQPGLEGYSGHGETGDKSGRFGSQPEGSAWAGGVWIPCPDGKQRLVEPGLRLLVDGLPGRLRKAALHGYGNAIVPQVAAEFIGAYMEGNL